MLPACAQRRVQGGRGVGGHLPQCLLLLLEPVPFRRGPIRGVSARGLALPHTLLRQLERRHLLLAVLRQGRHGALVFLRRRRRLLEEELARAVSLQRGGRRLVRSHAFQCARADQTRQAEAQVVAAVTAGGFLAPCHDAVGLVVGGWGRVEVSTARQRQW